MSIDPGADLRSITEDTSAFGRSVTVTDPDGTTAVVVGVPNDIGQTLDLDTDQLISNRQASVTFTRDALTEAGLGEPTGVQDSSAKPWVMVFNGRTYKVTDVRPENSPHFGNGAVVCMLEGYSR